MHNLSIPVNDAISIKFTQIQKKYSFKNQSDCLEYIIEQTANAEATK